MLVMKGGKRHLTDGIKLPHQEKIRTFREQETSKYLSILDTIRQVDMKEKIKKNISGELESYSRLKYLQYS